jgi:peptidoglycan/xylan/chitin deacetylase (PgdA/CDA1 family)
MGITPKDNWKRKFGFKILRYSGLPFIFRELVQRKRATILLFHDITVETAEQTFKYLTKKYNLISLDDYLNFRLQKSFNKLPSKVAIITFDDGFKQNYELLPIIEKYSIPVTIFLCAGLVNTNRHFWFEENNSPYPFGILEKKGNEEKLKILAKSGFEQEKEYQNPQVLSKKQIIEMKETVSFQSHGLFHPCLPNCSDGVSRDEIARSKQILENEYGLEINAFAYPNGDYSQREIKYLKEAGYTCALTVDFGFNTSSTNPFRLKRICVNDADDFNELIVKASGIWNILPGISKKV